MAVKCSLQKVLMGGPYGAVAIDIAPIYGITDSGS